MAAIFTPVTLGPFAAATATGNLYDIAATFTFTLAGQDDIVVKAYWTGSGTDFAVRFTPTAVGTWSYTSSSAQAELDGLSGTVDCTADATARGFLVGAGSAGTYWGRQVGDGTVEALDMPFLMATFHLERFLNDTTAQAAGYADLDDAIQQVFVAPAPAHGMSGRHMPTIGGRFFNINSTTDNEGSTITGTPENPDPDTFTALENIVIRMHAAGLTLMIWPWGDASRNQTPANLLGGENGAAHQRLMRYIAARLGPLPGWAMGYGFDSNEWTDPGNFETSVAYYRSQTTYQTFMGIRHGPASDPTSLLDASDQAWFGLTGAAYDDACQHVPNTGDIFTMFSDLVSKTEGDRPRLSGDRFRVTEAAGAVPGAPDSDGGGGIGGDEWHWTVDQTIRGMHGAAIHGIAAIWGRLDNSPSTIGWEGSTAYPATTQTQMATYRTFWDLHFDADLALNSALVDNAAATAKAGKIIALVYEAGTLGLNLTGLGWDGATVTYVDAMAAYATVDGGEIEATDQTLTLPSTSTWLVVLEEVVDQGAEIDPTRVMLAGPDVQTVGGAVLMLAPNVVMGTAPTDIFLDNSSVTAGSETGRVVGRLSANGDAPHAFSEAGGSNLFSVNGNEVRTSAAVTEGSYPVTVRVENAAGAVSETFTIEVITAAEGTLFSAPWNSGTTSPELGVLTKWKGADLSTLSLHRGGLRGVAGENSYTFNLAEHGQQGSDGTLSARIVAWDGSTGLSEATKLIWRWADNANWWILDFRNTSGNRFVQIRRMIDGTAITVAGSLLTNDQVAALFTSFTWGSDGSMSSDIGVRIVMDGPDVNIYLKDITNDEEVLYFTLNDSAHQTLARHGFIVTGANSIIDDVQYIGATTPPAISGVSSLTIADDAPIGTVIGTIQFSGSPTPELTLTSDPDNKLGISGSNLVTTATLDATADNAHPFTITATNSVDTATFDGTVTVTEAVDLPGVTSVTMGGVTFSWDQSTPAGLDPTGRPWVLEPPDGLTGMVVSPDRSTQNGNIVHGLMLNPARHETLRNSPQAFDQRMVFWDATLEVSDTIGGMTLHAGDKLLKAISALDITSVKRATGSASEYACLHVVSSPPANAAQSVLRATITWPNRNDPSNWYNNVDMATLLANRPTFAIPASEWRSFSELEARVIRYNPVYGMNTADGADGYENYFPRKWASDSGNTNYGEWACFRVNDCAMALIGTGHGYTQEQIETIAWSMLRLGIESADPLQGKPTGNLARGAHLEWHIFPVGLALNLTGRANEMRNAFDYDGFINGNVSQCFQITQQMHDDGYFSPHNESGNGSLFPGGWLRRTLGSQAGAAANQVLVPKTNSHERSNRGTKWIKGMTLKTTDGSKSVGIELMGNVDDSDPWVITLVANSPFVSGDVVYCDCPSEWIEVGKYDWSENGPFSSFNKYSPSSGSTYQGAQGFGSQFMALHALGMYDAVFDPAIGYMKRSETANEPTADNDYPGIVKGDPGNYYHANYWTYPF